MDPDGIPEAARPLGAFVVVGDEIVDGRHAYAPVREGVGVGAVGEAIPQVVVLVGVGDVAVFVDDPVASARVAGRCCRASRGQASRRGAAARRAVRCWRAPSASEPSVRQMALPHVCPLFWLASLPVLLMHHFTWPSASAKQVLLRVLGSIEAGELVGGGGCPQVSARRRAVAHVDPRDRGRSRCLHRSRARSADADPQAVHLAARQWRVGRARLALVTVSEPFDGCDRDELEVGAAGVAAAGTVLVGVVHEARVVQGDPFIGEPTGDRRSVHDVRARRRPIWVHVHIRRVERVDELEEPSGTAVLLAGQDRAPRACAAPDRRT